MFFVEFRGLDIFSGKTIEGLLTEKASASIDALQLEWANFFEC